MYRVIVMAVPTLSCLQHRPLFYVVPNYFNCLNMLSNIIQLCFSQLQAHPLHLLADLSPFTAFISIYIQHVSYFLLRSSWRRRSEPNPNNAVSGVKALASKFQNGDDRRCSTPPGQAQMQFLNQIFIRFNCTTSFYWQA